MSDFEIGGVTHPGKSAENTSFFSSSQNAGWLESLSRKLVLQTFQQLQKGSLTLVEGDSSYHFGEAQDATSLHAHVRVHNPSVYRELLFGGSIGAAESYMMAEWTTPCLVSVVRVLCANMEVLNQMDGRWSSVKGLMNRLMHKLNRNSRSGSRKNIAAHYDLGNEFFKLFLDPSLMYSSAIYPSETSTLEEASLYKLDAVCSKLGLTQDDHLLEIGTGWGGLAIHAAKHYGCRVTTTTLSKEQYQHAKQAVAEAGLEDRITLLLKDYRDLTGQYDKLVSIEMIEAVGHEYYPTYFSKCSSLLKDDGLMLIQAITITDQRYEAAKNSVDFIQKYIFPGGGLPSNTVMAQCIANCTNMTLVDLHDIGLDYAKTLADWRERFHQRIETVRRQGFDDVFCRMWDFYLAYCEGGFRERVISTVQAVMAKPDARDFDPRF
ncbi:cyclopropane-fatty-acyl-phospholipid synthase family protein [Aestuariicella sp. G3-2]|uniref:SAM-dependent methyltransferase n=1 Tax=Pseudomaricurvus albidus TaxID=2842452 RepID=UPI001C0CC08B|nr:cyclopropane-fatty-acyl-phospholipid synthase family protein [Aestuariicella albida]MBU3071633.1 cyclopropane-fatty-acyl-phospholipid synthase family protein [Aestuariicella albida]